MATDLSADPAASPSTGQSDKAASAALAKVVARLDNNETRPGQVEMAKAVAQALATGTHLSVAAGTGVGKSLAYLVPAVLSGKRVVIATATKVLQDQLADNDLPLVCDALGDEVSELRGRPLSFAVLKGRNNYLCRLRLDKHTKQLDPLPLSPEGKDAERALQLKEIGEWADRTATGDRAELKFQPLPGIWEQMSVSGTQCIGKQLCEFGARCFSEQARDHAGTADVVITNQHLYTLAVARLPEGALLGNHDAVVIDEAHQFETSATTASSIELTSRQLTRLADEAQELARKHNGPKQTEALEHSIKSLRSLAKDLHSAIEPYEGERVELEQLHSSADGSIGWLLERVDGQLETLRAALSSEPGDDDFDGTDTDLRMLKSSLGEKLEHVRQFAAADSDSVAWVEELSNSLSLKLAPIEVGDFLASNLWEDRTAILTSATLSTAMNEKLGITGLHDHRHLRVESPFNYENNSLLYCAKHLPNPNEPNFREGAIEVMAELVGAAGGRTLALFTSWNALKETADALEIELEGSIKVLRQGGDLTNSQLLDVLEEEPATVICATMSFWQGVDIPGPALSLLTIDRLPFSRPNDPLMSARRDAAKQDERHPFMTVDVPHTASLLAQGVGRLIRTSTDRGVVAVLDQRLATKGYRAQLLEPVPPMKRTVNLSEAADFLRSTRGSESPAPGR